jgi:hypothetical protein
MRPEYDLRGGVRGKYYERYKQGTNVVLLEPDIAKVFRDSATVNKALRQYAKLAGADLRGSDLEGINIAPEDRERTVRRCSRSFAVRLVVYGRSGRTFRKTLLMKSTTWRGKNGPFQIFGIFRTDSM